MIAARTGQEFNQGKNRKEAYRADRYHATAVEMVRAGVIEHPSEWAFSGYSEIQVRDGRWTESVAVGSEAFVAAAKEKLGFRGEGAPGD